MCIRGRLARLLGIVATAATVLLAGVASAAPNPNYPDLPAQHGFDFAGSGVDTLSFAESAQQWIKIDDARIAADTLFTVLPRAAGQPVNLGLSVYAYVVDNAHSVPQNYGEFPVTRIRTVAFGAVPAEATVHVTQLRDSEGLLEPIRITNKDETWVGGEGPLGDTHPSRYELISDAAAEGRVDVRVSDVTVDGVDIAVGDDCRAKKPAELVAHGEGYVPGDYTPPPGTPPGRWVPPGKYNAALGGYLTGTISIPAFSGCGVGGEDLSPLVTAIASGEGFPTEIHQAIVTGYCFNKNPALLDVSKCNWADAPIPSRQD